MSNFYEKNCVKVSKNQLSTKALTKVQKTPIEGKYKVDCNETKCCRFLDVS